MRILSFLHISLVAFLLSGMGYCTRDGYEGPEARLLVKEYGTPDSKYTSEVSVYLNGYKGAKVMIDINTNYQWFVDNPSFYAIPSWCQVSVPSGLIPTGFVTDKTLIFTDKGDNLHPFVEKFDLILRHSQDPNLKVTVHVYRNTAAAVFDVFDSGAGALIQAFKSAPNGRLDVPGNGGEILFELHTDRDWQLVLRPTGTNRSEHIMDAPTGWIEAIEIDGVPLPMADFETYGVASGVLPVSATPPDVRTIKIVVKENTSARYPRYAEMELKGVDGNLEGFNAIKIPIVQATAEAYLIFTNTATTPAGWFADYTYSVNVPALNPDGTANDLSFILYSESNRNWKVASTDYTPAGGGWVSVAPDHGDLNTTVAPIPPLSTLLTFAVAPNPSLTETRVATLTFTGEHVVLGATVQDLVKEFTVTQPPKVQYWYCDVAGPYNFTCDQSGPAGAQAFTIVSNHPWRIVATGGDSGIFTVSPNIDNSSVSNVSQTIYVYPTVNNTTSGAYSATYDIECNGVVEGSFTVSQGAFIPTVTMDPSNPVLAGTLPHARWMTFTTNFEVSSVSGVGDLAMSSLTLASLVNGSYTYNVVAGAGDNPYDYQVNKTFNVVPVNSGYGVQTGTVVQDARWYFSGIPASMGFNRGTKVIVDIRPGRQEFYVNGYFGGHNWAVSLSEAGNDVAWLAVFSFGTADSQNALSGGALGARIYVQPRAMPGVYKVWTAVFSVPNSYMTWTLTITQTTT